MIRFYLVCCFFLLLNITKGQDLIPDHDFGDEGITGFSFPNSFLQGYKVDQTKDGSYLAINYIINYKTNKSGFSLFMISGNGEIDSTFATNGHFEYYTNHIEYPADFIILPDNKIALAFTDNSGKIELVILHKNGKVYKNFKLSPFPNHYTIPIRLLFKDEYLYIGGIYNSINLNKELMFIMKLNIEGKFDEAFGEKGIFLSEKIIELNAKFQDMTFQEDDLIVYAAGNDSLSDHVFIYRLNEDGTGDLNFSYGGILFIEKDNKNGFGTIKTDKSGNIYLVPYDYPEVIKISKDGTPIQNYGINGVAIDNYFLDKMNSSYFSILQKDNSVMIFGSQKLQSGNLSPSIISFNENGNRDVNFAFDGLFSDNSGINGSYFNGCFDRNNKLVIIGSFKDSNGNQKSFLSRYELQFTGIKENINSEIMEIFPNPISGNVIHLICTNYDYPVLDFEIYDLLGKKLQSGKTSSYNQKQYSISIDNDILNGIYSIVIRNDNFSRAFKLLVER